MRKVKVRIKRSIAEKGCGFIDIEGKQEMFPRGKKGELVVDKEFEVWETPFIKGKISSGELVVKGEVETGESKSGLLVNILVNGAAVDSMEITEGLTEDELLEAMGKRKKVMNAVKDKGIKAIEFGDNEIRVMVK
jgi:hypothetical protein